MRRWLPDSIPLRTAKWFGSAAGVVGALIIAMNLGLVVHGFRIVPRLVHPVECGGLGAARGAPTRAAGNIHADQRDRDLPVAFMNMAAGPLLAALLLVPLALPAAATERISGVASVIDGDNLPLNEA